LLRAALLTAVLLVGFTPTARAATVSFASYTNESHAFEQARSISERLGVETRLVPVEVEGVPYLRILGPSGMTVDAARALLERARAAGFDSAWMLSRDPAPAVGERQPPASVSEPQTAAESGSPAAVPVTAAAVEATTAAGPSSGPTRAAVETLDPHAAAPTTMAVPAMPGTAPERLLLTTVTLEGGASILVARLEESEIEFQLDGRLDEPVWQQVHGYDEMRVLEPDTLEVPRHRTVMRYFYTSRALYVSMYAEQPPETLIERLSSRDDYFLRDSMSVTLDTSGTGIYGYWFSVNLGDSLADGKVAPERQYSSQWDGPWDGRSARHDKGWSAEMVLPWSMMAMPGTDGERTIGLYASRLIGYLDERIGFPALPPTGARFMSALQAMEFDDVRPRRQLDFYPYVSGTYDAAAEDSEGKVGVDMFWRPSTNLQMSATVNPDFGAVESDDVVINLTATETFFPEKRLFFLEGNEIFGTTPRSRPFSPGGRQAGSRRTTQLFNPEPTQVVNTRRIGGAADVIIPPDVFVSGVEQSKPTDLIGALKATGQVGRMRYGAMGAIEDDVTLRGISEDGEEVPVDAVGRDFGVARLLYEDVGQSRKSIGYIGTYVKNQSYDAVVHGIDGHFLNRSGKLQADLQLLASDVDAEKGYGGMLDVNYTQRRGLTHTLRLDAQDDKLDINDLGFLRRNDNYGGGYFLNYSRSQGLKRLRRYQLSWRNTYWQNGAGQTTRVGTFLNNTFTFRNLFELRTEVNYFPARWEDLESEGNGSYRIKERWGGDLAFGTDASKVFSFSGRVSARGEDLGGWATIGAIGVTYKPNHRFSLDLDLNYQDRDGWLLHTVDNEFTTYGADDFQPRLGVDLFISARQQFRMSLQWAAIKAKEQQRWILPEDGDLIPVEPEPGAPSRDFAINRMTVQARYRWQIAPLSDLFVVYTRGSNFPSSIDDEFSDMFVDALQHPVVDLLVVKLRYRFGM
jgi:hypothetical protein